MSSPSPASPARSRKVRILSIVFSVVVLGAVALFVGQAYIPLPGVSDCTVTDIVEEDGRRGNDITMYVTSCGDYYTDHGDGIEVGGTYDFALRGLIKTNIADWSPAS